jgi:hypothetical protein
MQTLSKSYIRILVNSLCQSCLGSSNAFKFRLFQNFCPVLIKFVNKNKTIELEILNAISTFSLKYSTISNFFDSKFEEILTIMLCERNVVTNEAYQKWIRKSNRNKTPKNNDSNSKNMSSQLKNNNKESQAIAIEEKYDNRNQNETNNLIELENKLKKIFISFEYISAPEAVIFENLQVSKFNFIYSEKKF